jgi:hypothetical protein
MVQAFLDKVEDKIDELDGQAGLMMMASLTE